MRYAHQAIRDPHFKNKGTWTLKPEASDSPRSFSPDTGVLSFLLDCMKYNGYFLSARVGGGVVKAYDVAQENYDGDFTLMHNEGKWSF